MSKRVGYYLLVVLVCAITFSPIYWMVVTTIRPAAENLRYPPKLWPTGFDLSSFRALFRRGADRALDSQLDDALADDDGTGCPAVGAGGVHALDDALEGAVGIRDLPADDADAARKR